MNIQKQFPMQWQSVKAKNEASADDKGYAEAIDYIKSAIAALGESARTKGDAIAKEAIANLSVVLLDLKS